MPPALHPMSNTTLSSKLISSALVRVAGLRWPSRVSPPIVKAWYPAVNVFPA